MRPPHPSGGVRAPHLVGVGVAATAALLLAAGAAWASGSVQVPPGPVTAAGTVALAATATADEKGSLELRVTAPPDATGKAPAPVAAAAAGPAKPTDGDRTLKYGLTTTPCNLVPPCGKGATAPNGTWTAALVETFPAGPERVLDSRTFVLDLTAAPPADVTATLAGTPGQARTVTVRWARGPEPDLLRWDVTDGAGRSQRVDLPQDPKAASPCDAQGVCSTTLTYRPVETGSRTYSVTATRACATKGCTPTPSAATSSPPVSLSGPAAASGSPSARPPSPAGATARGTTAPGPGNGTATVLPREFLAPAPTSVLGAPQVPQLPAPQVAPPQEAAGGFQTTLNYPAPVDAAPGGRAAPSRLTSTGGGLLQDQQLMQSVAGALVLALGGAHLRSWVRRAGQDS